MKTHNNNEACYQNEIVIEMLKIDEYIKAELASKRIGVKTTLKDRFQKVSAKTGKTK